MIKRDLSVISWTY